MREEICLFLDEDAVYRWVGPKGQEREAAEQNRTGQRNHNELETLLKGHSGRVPGNCGKGGAGDGETSVAAGGNDLLLLLMDK